MDVDGGCIFVEIGTGSFDSDESFSCCRLELFIVFSILDNNISELCCGYVCRDFVDINESCSSIKEGRLSTNMSGFSSSLRCFHKTSEIISPSVPIA